ncbi:hypothetical protein GCM10007170_40490 [Arthrobacter liuii]|uniref:Lipoprotein n=2 Tax=Arthrobacter liuii TaxID=1476996 RepID=A0ABQ2AY05_9MICC|nr:hypothetical protein GCM10007170_40490 [Arthrobacter liuii]
MQKRVFSALAALVVLGLGLAGCSSGGVEAQGATQARTVRAVASSPGSIMSVSTAGNDIGLQKHLDAVNKFMASHGGGKILATKSVPFQKKTGTVAPHAPTASTALARGTSAAGMATSAAIRPAALVVPAAQNGFGNTCTLYVTLGFTYRSDTSQVARLGLLSQIPR